MSFMWPSMLRARFRLSAVSVFLLAFACPGFAASFSSLTVFGDSLSDNGNAYLLSGGVFPGANYGSYTFSNGLKTEYFSDGPNTTPAAAGAPGLWVDKLAAKLGVADPLPFASNLPNATNYAIASAQTGTANPQDVGNQIAIFNAKNPSGASPTSLYAFWAGANDILDGNSPIQAADNIEKYILDLHGEGAQDFLWLNLPLLGDTPRGSTDRTALNAASVLFNSEWAKDIAALQGDHISVTGVNIGGLFAEIYADPSKFGFSNITTAAQGLSLPNDAGYLSWDGLHPTTAGHTLVADAAYAALTATPEPASIGFVAVGLLAVAAAGLRRRATR